MENLVPSIEFVLLLGLLLHHVTRCLAAPILQSPTIEAWTIVIESTTNDFASSNNYAAMAVVQSRLRCLFQAEGQISIPTWRHGCF